jgi:CubicO group peptidase (beta-lactamase class C family)
MKAFPKALYGPGTDGLAERYEQAWRTDFMNGVDIGTAMELGFDHQRLERIMPFLDERYIATGLFPHAQLLISRRGRTVLSASTGAAGEDGAPLRDDSLFRIASMTKPVTAVAFMMLVEEGRVALDQPVHRVIPEFRGLGVYAGGGEDAPFATTPTDSPMRMIDLLRHTSGLTYGFQNQGPVDAAYRQLGLDEFQQDRDSDGYIAALAGLPLESSPGTAWNYSVSTDVLGVVIERLSGMNLADFFAQCIFGPLGMNDTFFQVPADRLDRLTDAWTIDSQRGRILYDRGAKSRWRMPLQFYPGGGGLVSSTADYHRFCRMMLDGGIVDGVRLLSPKTVALMTQNHLPGGADLSTLSRSMFSESQNAGVGFGLGVAVTQNPAKGMLHGSPGEYYWGGLFSTYFFIDPAEQLIAIFMTQVMPSSAHPVRRELKTLIYSALSETYL